MEECHYLGAPSKTGQTVWYAADDGGADRRARHRHPLPLLETFVEMLREDLDALG